MTIRAWISACRPATLTAAAAPVAVGTACAIAEGGSRPDAAAAALAGALLLQIGTNLANDVYDFERGADTPDRLGPVRATASGAISTRAMKIATVAVFAAAMVPGAYLAAVAGWPVIAIGIAAMIAGAAYTAGPYPLAYHGLGDVFVMAFFGYVAVCGTAFVQLGRVPDLAWWAALPVGALATAILAVNNARDVHTDALAGKRTIAVRFGRSGARAEYALLLAAAYAVPLLLWLRGDASPAVLLPLATLPIAVRCLRVLMSRRDGPALNRCLATTARLLLAYSLAFAVGIAW